MKNQYFGDIRDLFKYDLIEYIVTRSEFIERCIWVPMLTSNDTSFHGERRSRPKAGFRNEELRAFLDTYDRERSERNISHLQTVRFFREPRVLVFSRRRNDHDYLPDFDQSSRRAYFTAVERALRPNSLVFLDPDTGIETSTRRRERHVRLSEIAALRRSLDAGSVVMIYQHHHMVERPIFFRDVSRRIANERDPNPLYISDNEIAFFFLTNAPAVRRELSELLEAYAAGYAPKIVAGP